MAVIIPINNMDFDFNSARSSPYPSPPSTPRRFGDYYCSAPSSPSRLTSFYQEFDDFLSVGSKGNNGSSSAETAFDDEDFAFDVGGEVKIAAVSAEELFDGGMIKPLKPQSLRDSSSRSPKSKSKRTMGDPFGYAEQRGVKLAPERERGRERIPGISSSSRRATRSVSPLRVSQYPWEEEQELLQKQKQASMEVATSSSSSALTTSSSKGRKWRLKDFFLFRSASEGRASDKDPLKKYTALFRKIESPSSDGSRRRRRVSAHELHYNANRAAKEDLKKKTFLPYKQGILGRLAFNPAVHALGFAFHK